MPGLAIEIENLTKEYPFGFLHLKKKTSLEGLNMQVETGEVFGFIGPNGAGKSTTIKLLMGLIFPTSRGTTTRVAMDSSGRFEGIVECPSSGTTGSMAGTSVRSSMVVGRRRCVVVSAAADKWASFGTRILSIIVLFFLVRRTPRRPPFHGRRWLRAPGGRHLH